MNTFIIFVYVLLRIGLTIHIPSRTGSNIHCDGTNHCQYHHIISGTECNIECTATGSCRNADIIFSNHCDYGNLNCSAFHACYASNITCARDGYCEINTGAKSIKRSSVHCASNGICLLHCNDIESCAFADIHCADESQCFVECHGKNSCAGVTIRAESARSLHIICKDKSCVNLQAYCPINSTHCLFDIDGDENEGIEIYSTHGLSQEFRVMIHDPNAPQITLHCEFNYSSSCKISSTNNQCTDAFHICNGDTDNGAISTTDVEIDYNVTSSSKRNTFALREYVDSIRNNKLVLWVTLICAITCSMICCYICCEGFRFIFKLNDATKPKQESPSMSFMNYEGHNVDYRKSEIDDEYDSESLSISI